MRIIRRYQTIAALSLIASFWTAMTISAHSEDTTNLAAAYNQSGLALYKELAKTEGNIAISPLSINSTMDMALLGARGETATQMHSFLAHSLEQGALPKAYSALFIKLNGEQGEPGVLSVANALALHQQNLRLSKRFLTTIKEDYNAEFFPTADPKIINPWVERNTGGKIKELVDKPSNDTALLLLNAVHFKAKWETPFDPNHTTNRPFFIKKDQPINVPTMVEGDNWPISVTDDYSALRLPFANNAQKQGSFGTSIILLLPKPNHDLADIEKKLDAAELTKLLNGTEMRPDSVDLLLPRFDFAYEAKLKEPYQKLGLRLPFTEGKADFSGMLPKDSKQELYIGKIKHKAQVTIDEEGAEASATTALEMMVTSSVLPKRTEFNANRPFMFFIVDNDTKALIMMGRVVDPRAK